MYNDKQWFEKLFSEKENNYLDLDCYCSGTVQYNTSKSVSDKNMMVCGHYGAFMDERVRNVAFTILKHGESRKITSYFDGLDENYLKRLDDTCMFEKPVFLKTWRTNLSGK